MKKNFIILLLVPYFLHGQNANEYEQVFMGLNNMLSTNGSFKKAVFMVEKGFDNTLSEQDFNEEIEVLKDLSLIRLKDHLLYDKKDSAIIKKYAAIFKTITDTTKIQIGSQTFNFFPFRYDFDDIFGDPPVPPRCRSVSS